MRWRATGDAGLSAPTTFSFMPPAAHNSKTLPERRRGRPPGPVRLLSPQEVAERLSVPLKTIYDWTYKPCALDGGPLLPVVRLGRRVRVSEAALAALPDRLAQRAPAAFSFFSEEVSGS